MEYRDFINTNMNDVITALNGSITPAPVNSELYRDFLNRKADDVITALNGSITPAPAGDELYRDFIERKFDDVIAGIGGYVPPVTFPTVSGSICTFNSQYAGLPLKSHKVNIDSVSGVSSFNIYATVKNLFAYYFNNFKTASNSITIAPNNTNSVNVSGTYAGGGGARAWSYDGKTQANYGNYIQFLEDTSLPIEAGTYTMSSVSETPSNFINYVLIGDSNDYGQTFANSQPSLQKFYLNPNNNHTFTVASGKRMAIMTEVRGMSTGVSIDATLTIQLEKNGINTSIETVTPHTISIGQTVKAGTYNARSGVFIGDYDYVDLGTLNYQYTDGFFYTQSIRSFVKRPETNDDIIALRCNLYTPTSRNDLVDNLPNYSMAVNTAGTLQIVNNDYSTSSDFKTAMNGVYLKYPVASPTLLQLPSCPIDTLEGVNNIWADTGDTTLQYIKIGGIT